MTSNFHKNSDTDRFYIPRKLDGRGIKEIMTLYECKRISAKKHLIQNKKNNKYLNKVIGCVIARRFLTKQVLIDNS